MRIASVDEVREGIIYVTMASEARGTPLRGQYVTVRSGKDIVLGRLREINLTNPIHSNPLFKPWLMVNGRLEHWSSEVDIEQGVIEEIDRRSENGDALISQTNPRSGTEVMLASAEDINRFYSDSDYWLALGEIPYSDIPLTVVNRDFGKYSEGGHGEAKHWAIFGQSGSGKSVFATMRISGLLVRHPRMGLLIPDTAGDLSDPTRHDRGEFRWNYATVLRSGGVKLETIDIGEIRLTEKPTLELLLEPVLKEAFRMGDKQASSLTENVVEDLFESYLKSENITPEDIFAAVQRQILSVYAEKTRQEKVRDVNQFHDNPATWNPWVRKIQHVREFFDGRENLRHLVKDVLEKGRKVIIRMQGMIERDQAFVIKEVMHHIWNQSKIIYKNGKETANALVVLDEAHNWVPQEGEGTYETAKSIVRAFKETRKYGLGWMVISTRPAAVKKDVISDAHTKYFGCGLGVGADAAHLKDILGEDGEKTYKRLQSRNKFFFVGTGDDANLGRSYFALQMFGGDATKKFMEANSHIFMGVTV